MTPTALYEIFVTICKRKLHVIISYDAERDEEVSLLKKHSCLSKNAFHFVIQVQNTHYLYLYNVRYGEPTVATIATTHRLRPCTYCVILRLNWPRFE